MLLPLILPLLLHVFEIIHSGNNWVLLCCSLWPFLNHLLLCSFFCQIYLLSIHWKWLSLNLILSDNFLDCSRLTFLFNFFTFFLLCHFLFWLFYNLFYFGCWIFWRNDSHSFGLFQMWKWRWNLFRRRLVDSFFFINRHYFFWFFLDCLFLIYFTPFSSRDAASTFIASSNFLFWKRINLLKWF